MKMVHSKEWSGDLRSKLRFSVSLPGRNLQDCLQNGVGSGRQNDLHNGLHSSLSSTLLDLRSSEDFHAAHFCDAVNTPLRSLTAATPSPFNDVEVLKTQWRELKDEVGGHGTFPNTISKSGPVVVVCYHGETARLACSLMRAQGIETYSIKGGMSVVLDAMKFEDDGKQL